MFDPKSHWKLMKYFMNAVFSGFFACFVINFDNTFKYLDYVVVKSTISCEGIQKEAQ